MDNSIDLLQIKIDKAKSELPPETLAAINAVDWKGVIYSFREKKGYNFEQLGELELETELLLCGLLSPKEYPIELEKRMRIRKGQVDELVHDMNDLVFKRIREEMTKNEQRNKSLRVEIGDKAEAPKPNIEIKTPPAPPNPIPEVGKPEITGSVIPPLPPSPARPQMLEKKLTQVTQSPPKTTSYGAGRDPYRLPPE